MATNRHAHAHAHPFGNGHEGGCAHEPGPLPRRDGSTAAPGIRLENVTVAYRRHPAVHHLSGEFAPGSLTAVVGPNGAGKSTLLKAIMGTLRPESGRIEISGIDRRDIAYLPQISELDRTFPITVLDLVSMGLWRKCGAFGAVTRAMMQQVREAVATVGLADLADRPVGTLSGGQFQRALFARMLLQDARLLLLDEPFTALDMKTTADLLRLVKDWHGENRTIIAVLHDLDLVREHFPRAMLLARSVVAWGDAAKVLTPANMLEARRMCEGFDEDAPVCRSDAA
ncbi:zinc/manganese transport system ATP-binding protein [Pseudochelatococcus lubricantis]|uniref:Zinc/manganese transport system ATP-binding protein n=1 Tax=Pseudochelatococcus lubricantis TaxID=1538102 RepID=A0ABX0V2I1_9HYPH|nr:zinc ABC transporter ATP-binding protein AztA [Pseudochelatococcus lubricantis]NIJ58550.1 zinc/manganese transport system ATP-binding protein [Pseudochelatococcus lubricantis]